MTSSYSDYLAYFEGYYYGTLSEIDKIFVENKFLTDNNFVEEYELFKLSVKGLKARGEKRVRSILTQTEQKLDKQNFFDKTYSPNQKVRKGSGVPRLTIAASILLCLSIGAYFYSSNFQNNQTAIASFYQPEQTNLPVILERLTATGFALDKKEQRRALKKALLPYQQQKYQLALTGLLEHQQKYPEDTICNFYLGLTYLETGDFKKANVLLQNLSSQHNFEYQPAAEWYYALATYRLKDKTSRIKALTLIKTISTNIDSPYHKNAINFLKAVQH